MALEFQGPVEEDSGEGLEDLGSDMGVSDNEGPPMQYPKEKDPHYKDAKIRYP